ncbi:uncharacterized protein BKCO1_3000068 [Diplodia corticola]|uniref:Uncharacterized protein n=1 Tax=Diplodia corticola TaxID=236234 RepID=A0A1J9RLM3_9PEZI|nr:uncharacterized protein BKCO1_3000068 [Diplodia corticola]OJD33475.1 hypothetical protein BKCO1_3000068 [Diplodia corticola]
MSTITQNKPGSTRSPPLIPKAGLQTQVVYTDAEGGSAAAVLPTPIIPPAGQDKTTTNMPVGTVLVLITYTKGITGTNMYAYALDNPSIVSTIKPPQTTSTVEDTSQASTVRTVTSSTSASTVRTATSSTSAPSPSPTKPTNAQDGKGLSSGAAAGIGVGAAMGGILLASLVFFFCSRRSRKREPRYNPEAPRKQLPSYGENKTSGVPQVTAIDMRNSSVETHPPQPVADDSISNEMSTLKSMIDSHVVSYYRTSEIDSDAIDEPTLAGLMETSRISASQMVSAIASPQIRTPALRYLIASAIFSRIGPKSQASSSFLPPEVASCLESMTGMQDDEHARTALLSKWRAITASMLQQTYGSKVVTESDPRWHNIGRVLDELDSVLVRLRARRDENANRRQNLEEILKRATGFAFLLFSHPSSWEFEWQTGPGHEPGSVVIFPALLQVTDENGEKLGSPRPFEEVETAILIT